MVDEVLFLQRMAGETDAVLITPVGNALRKILGQQGAHSLVEVPPHEFGRRVGAPVERGQHGLQIVAVALLKNRRQCRVPWQEAPPAGPGGRIVRKPGCHEIRLVGVESFDLPAQRTEAADVFLVGQ